MVDIATLGKILAGIAVILAGGALSIQDIHIREMVLGISAFCGSAAAYIAIHYTKKKNGV